MSTTTKPLLLSGGNPQIAKGEGEEKVQEYIDAVPGWKQDICRTLDDLITRAVPSVHKSVRWNTPFYGMSPKDWFVGFHCLTRYVKVSFPVGTDLDPIPPGTSKQARVRYLDIYEDKPFDAAQFTSWIKQASTLPGEKF
jgi:hypothetical protein